MRDMPGVIPLDDLRDPPRGRGVAAMVAVSLVALSIWAFWRYQFGLGIAGSDDLHHLRFALTWDRAPINHWEARLMYNLLVTGSLGALGSNEFAAVLPALAASALTLVVAVAFVVHRAGWQAGLVAGLILAWLPGDIAQCTTLSAYPLMTALVTVGVCATLWKPATATTRWIGVIALALGPVAHLAGVYFVACFGFALLLANAKRWWTTFLAIGMCGVAALLADMVLFDQLYAHPLHRFVAAQAQSGSENPYAPLMVAGAVNAEFFIWPLRNLLISKDFGVLLSLSIVLGIAHWGRLSRVAKTALLTIGLFWLYMSFGTQVPWEYKPFWRMGRFLLPLLPLVAIALGLLYVRLNWQWRSTVAAGLALNAMLPLLDGAWGQSVELTRELLEVARAHPDTTCVVDPRTANEIYALTFGATPTNLTVPPDTHLERLFDRARLVRNARFAERAHGWIVLENPLNIAREPALGKNLAEVVRRHASADEPGVAEALRAPVTERVYRDLARLIPPLRQFAWFERMPSAFATYLPPATGSLPLAQIAE